MKALAEKGGVIGIYMLPFLTEPPTQPMIKDFFQHLDHAVKICGEDHVGIGTDVPFLHVGEEELAELKRRSEERKAAGIAAPGEDRPAYIPDLNTERKLELVTDALLKRGYKSAAVEKILGGNFRSWPRSGPLPLKKMSRDEKLRAMEALWADLSQDENRLESPAWHGQALREQNAR